MKRSALGLLAPSSLSPSTRSRSIGHRSKFILECASRHPNLNLSDPVPNIKPSSRPRTVWISRTTCSSMAPSMRRRRILKNFSAELPPLVLRALENHPVGPMPGSLASRPPYPPGGLLRRRGRDPWYLGYSRGSWRVAARCSGR